jgi:hypothetical protein
LGGRGEPVASGAIALRISDHVPEVRAAAIDLIKSRTSAFDAAIVAPILSAASRRSVARDAFDRYLSSLDGNVVESLLSSPDRGVRLAAIERSDLSLAELLLISRSDEHLPVRLAAARKALNSCAESAGQLLFSRSSAIQALALTVADDELVAPHIERTLMHRGARVRRASQTRARRLEIDLPALYRDRLPNRIAVLGLGETGEQSDGDMLVPLTMESCPAPVRRAAIKGLARLWPSESVTPMLVDLISCGQPSVAREAGRQMKRTGFAFTSHQLDEALSAPHAWTRQIALGIAGQHRGWGALIAVLDLYDDEDEVTRSIARTRLTEWLDRRAPSAGMPTSQQAERIAEKFPESAPIDLRRAIAFHAGLSELH